MLTITKLGIPSRWEGIHGLKAARVCCSLRIAVVGCLVFMIYIGLSHVFAALMLVWLTQGDGHTFNELRRNIYTTS